MLCSLSIQDLAVVESLDLELTSGLSVLTGETGAGKSILMTALGLALGDRADSGYIRPGRKYAEINLTFDLNGCNDAQTWLTENRLNDGNLCIIRRVLSEEGRSKAFINNRPVTLQFLQELSSFLVEIHGQHAHLKLLNISRQLHLLDDYLENHTILEKLKGIHQRWFSDISRLNEMINKEQETASREDFLRFQINELEQGEVESLDYPALVEEHNIQSNVDRILGLGQEQLQRLYENEQHSVNALLGQSISAMSELDELAPEFREISGLLDEALIQVQESSRMLRQRIDALDSDPARLQWLDERLSVVHGLGKKYRTIPEQLANLLESLREELSSLERSSETVVELKHKVEGLEQEYKQLASRLSQIRINGAAQLQQRITENIKQLGMQNGEFLIKVSRQSNASPHANGFDKVEFLVTTNPGLPPRALGKIASGGELSRISLAIQVASMSAKTTPTMVFDEVDSGVGGGVAEIVGQRLRSLGDKKQVFCVTHLAQVAAQAHHHLLVEKLSDKDLTRSHVKKLSKEERKNEIGRMLGGIKITEQTLAHASEMLQWADSIHSSE